MQNPFTRRFLEAFELLMKRGVVTSQEEFAEALNFHPNYMGAFKAGRKQVRVEHLHNLFTKFSVNLYYIFTGKGYIMQEEEIPETYEAIKEKLEKANKIITVQEKIIHFKDEELAHYKELLRLEREKRDSSTK